MLLTPEETLYPSCSTVRSCRAVQQPELEKRQDAITAATKAQAASGWEGSALETAVLPGSSDHHHHVRQ